MKEHSKTDSEPFVAKEGAVTPATAVTLGDSDC